MFAQHVSTSNVQHDRGVEPLCCVAHGQIMERHSFDVGAAGRATAVNFRTQMRIVNFGSLEAIVNFTMPLLQIKNLIEPVHQQGFAVYSLYFNLPCRVFSLPFDSAESVHSSRRMLQ